MRVKYELKDITENETLDISMNFQYQNRLGKVYPYNLYPLWNCGVSVLGIMTHTFSHGPQLVWYNDKTAQNNYTTLSYEEWTVWTSIINQMISKKSEFLSFNACPFGCLPEKYLLEDNKLKSSLSAELHKLKAELAIEVINITWNERRFYLVLGHPNTDENKFEQAMLGLASQYNQPTVLMKEAESDEISVWHTAESKKETLGQFTPDKLLNFIEKLKI